MAARPSHHPPRTTGQPHDAPAEMADAPPPSATATPSAATPSATSPAAATPTVSPSATPLATDSASLFGPTPPLALLDECVLELPLGLLLAGERIAEPPATIALSTGGGIEGGSLAIR